MMKKEVHPLHCTCERCFDVAWAIAEASNLIREFDAEQRELALRDLRDRRTLVLAEAKPERERAAA